MKGRPEIGIVWLWVFVFVTILNAQRGDRPAFQAYYKALALIEEGQLRQALVYVDSAIAIKPNYSQFYVLKGQIYEFLNEPDSMLAAFEKALELKSYYPELWPRVARAYLQLGKNQKAVFYLEKSIEAFPDSLQFYIFLGEAYVRLERCRLAESYLKKYARLASHHPPLYWKWWGITQFCLNKYPEAIQALQRVVGQLPNDWEVLFYLGAALFENGSLDAGLSYLNQAYQKNPQLLSVFVYRARYFVHYNKMDKAIKQLQVALNLDSTNTAVLLELAKLEIERGNHEAAGQYLGRIIHINPRYWKAYRYLGIVAEAQNNLAQALKYYTLYMQHNLYADPEIEQRMEAVRKQLKNR